MEDLNILLHGTICVYRVKEKSLAPFSLAFFFFFGRKGGTSTINPSGSIEYKNL